MGLGLNLYIFPSGNHGNMLSLAGDSANMFLSFKLFFLSIWQEFSCVEIASIHYTLSIFITHMLLKLVCWYLDECTEEITLWRK